MYRLLRVPCFLPCLLLIASGGTAGPWLRDEGGVFLSFGANVALTESARRPVYWDPTLYLEYGVGERSTVGLDIYVANGDAEQTGSVFLRFPLRPAETGMPVAGTLTYGLRHDRARQSYDQVARAGLSVGRGLEGGWLSADLTAIYAVEAERFEGKLDLTWGVDLTDRWTGVLQMQTGIGTAGDFYAKAAPSVLFRVTDRVRIELGVVQALTGDEGTGLRLSTWLEF